MTVIAMGRKHAVLITFVDTPVDVLTMVNVVVVSTTAAEITNVRTIVRTQEELLLALSAP